MTELYGPIGGFLASPAGIAVKAALIAAFLDFGCGVFAAIRDDRLALDAIGAFIRKHLAGRVLPIALLAILAYITADAAAMTAAAGALTAYAIETTASVYASIGIKGSAKIPID